MDHSRFDELTRAFASGMTRRVLLRGVTGALALAAGVRADARAAAVKRKPGEICRKNGECIDGAICVQDASRRGRCACPPGWTLCGDACVDTSTNVANCGTCGNACPVAPDTVATCVGGECGLTCAPGTIDCNGVCIPAGGCCTHADCDDGDPCTLDLCGPQSHQCGHFSLGNSCVQADSTGGCQNGGIACGGRCCPPDSTCTTNSLGIPVCCPTCGTGCCDQISHATICDVQGCIVEFAIGAARCVYGEGRCETCPPLCTVVPITYYADIGDNEGTCGVNNACVGVASAPVGTWI